ncbi:MAG: hypothetical protein H8E78_05040 [Proteobacteria bacterium]|nr:hypothetical protein [Pseudomonadota bacterium]
MIFRKFLILFAMVLPIGCGNSSGDSDNRSNADAELGALIVKLLECDLVTDGDIPEVFFGNDCIADCIAQLNCEDLESELCGSVFPESIACLETCFPPFICGDGVSIDGVFECDVIVDCSDGSDEGNCSDADFFICSDGELLPASYECDFAEDCFDGGDEAGCAKLICS